MLWRAKNVGEALLPLGTTYAIIGHGVFQYPAGRRHPILSLIYAITITLLYWIAVGFTLKLCFESSWYNWASKIFFYIFYTNAAIAGLSQILSWYHARRLFVIVEKISRVDETLQELGASFDYTKSLISGIALNAFWLLTVCCLNAIDILWLYKVLPMSHILIVGMVFHHPMHINSIVVCNFSAAVRLVGMRFRKANDLLEKIATPVRQPVDNQAWRFLRNKISGSTFTLSTRRILKGAAYRKNVIQIIQHVHLELCAISKELNRSYGVQVAMQIAAEFVMFTGLLFDIYNVLKDFTKIRQIFRIIVHIIRCTTYFSKLMLMNVTCESVSAEARRTGNIIHCIDKTIVDPELPDEIQQFSLQIIQNPLYFCPAGFFTLGYKFVRGFLVTVTTYLVILVQMSGVTRE